MTTPTRPPKVGDVWGKGRNWWLIVWIDDREPYTAKIRHICNKRGEVFVDGKMHIWTFEPSWTTNEYKFNIFDDIEWSHIAEELYP